MRIYKDIDGKVLRVEATHGPEAAHMSYAQNDLDRFDLSIKDQGFFAMMLLEGLRAKNDIEAMDWAIVSNVIPKIWLGGLTQRTLEEDGFVFVGTRMPATEVSGAELLPTPLIDAGFHLGMRMYLGANFDEVAITYEFWRCFAPLGWKKTRMDCDDQAGLYDQQDKLRYLMEFRGSDPDHKPTLARI